MMWILASRPANVAPPSFLLAVTPLISGTGERTGQPPHPHQTWTPLPGTEFQHPSSQARVGAPWPGLTTVGMSLLLFQK